MEYVLNPEEYDAGYEGAEVNAGFVNEPLPKGRYPLKVEKLVKKGYTRNGVPEASLLLRVRDDVVDGLVSAGKTAIISLYLDASPVKKVDGEDVARTDVEKAKARNNAQGRIKGFLTALGMPHSNPVVSSADEPVDFLVEKFGLDNLAGCTFMAQIGVWGNDNGQNQIVNNHANDHEKFGLEAFIEKHNRMNGTSGGATAL